MIKTINGLVKPVNLLEKENLFNRISNAMSIRNIKHEQFMNDLNKLLLKYNF